MLVVISVLAFALLVAISVQFRLLRPIADDYCWAGSIADHGVIGSISAWFNAWTGDLTSVTSTAILVGAPLVYLPWGVASAVPAIAATVVVALLLATLGGAWVRTDRYRWRWVALLPIAGLTWWLFWWVSASTGLGSEQVNLNAYYVTFWQNINSAYVVLTALALLGWMLLRERSFAGRSRPWLMVTVCGIFGVAVGMAGYALALTLVLWAVCSAIVLGMRTWRNGIRHFAWPLAGRCAFFIAAGIGMWISFSSPGRRARAVVLDVHPSVLSLPGWTLPDALGSWAQGYIHVGSGVVVLIGAGMGYLVVRSGCQSCHRRLFARAGELAVLSLVFALLTRVAEAYAYPAPWHFSGPYVVICAAVWTASVGLGSWLASAITRDGVVIAIGAVPVIVMALALPAVFEMTGRVEDRYVAWNRGPAPIAGVMDIYTPGYFTTVCWYQIGTQRPLPPRPYAYPIVSRPQVLPHG